MTLEEQINADIKAAMLAKESKKLDALRAIKSQILLLKTSPEGLTPESELKTLQKMVKQRKETADVYKGQNREDLAADELQQAAVIEVYLPKQMDESEIRSIVAKLIEQVGAKTPADMGKVMGVATKEFAGKADNKIVSGIIKELLAQ